MRTCCGILVLKLLALTANAEVWAWSVTSMASDLSTFGSCLSAISFLKLYLSLRTRPQAQISWLRHYTWDVPSPCRQSCDQGLNCCSPGRRHISPKEFNPALGTAMPTSHLKVCSGIFCCCWVICSEITAGHQSTAAVVSLAIFSALIDCIYENLPFCFSSVIGYNASCIAAGTVRDS